MWDARLFFVKMQFLPESTSLNKYTDRESIRLLKLFYIIPREIFFYETDLSLGWFMPVGQIRVHEFLVLFITTLSKLIHGGLILNLYD